MFARIMVCLDGSSLSEQILPAAIELAQRFDATITLFTSVDMPPPASPEFPVESDLIQDLRRKDAQQYLSCIATFLEGTGLHVVTATAVGPAGPAIVEYAAANAIGLIAMGTHGRRNIGRLIYGSVTDHVLRHSAIPVLALKPVAQPE